MGQTIEIPIFCVSPKPIYDLANLSYVISAYSCSPLVCLLSVLFLFVNVFYIFLFLNKMIK